MSKEAESLRAAVDEAARKMEAAREMLKRGQREFYAAWQEHQLAQTAYFKLREKEEGQGQ